MKFPLSLHVTRDGREADIIDAAGDTIAEDLVADDARELLALIEKGRSIGRQGSNYDLPGDDFENFSLPRGFSKSEPVEAPLARRLAEHLKEIGVHTVEANYMAGLASLWAAPPADAATDSPTD